MKKLRTGNPSRRKDYNLILKKMKLTVLFSLVIFVTCWGNSFSQQTKLNLRIADAPVQDVLQIIEDQTNYYFIYQNDIFKKGQRVTIQSDDEELNKILDQLATQADISYEIADRQIILKGKGLIGSSFSQQGVKDIRGVVTGRQGEPIPGVTVAVKGTTKGIITDIDGRYILTKIPGNAVLVFSFVGMKTQEISVAGKTSINVTLEEETIGIDEIVAVGYGTQKKMNLTGAVAQVTADELVTQSVTSAAQAIQGRATGVEVIRNSGAPGATATIRIRGLGTFGNTEPLVLIDGIEGDINQVSSSEIESVNILKDASSCAIYGTRAANGVIIITTKKGTAGASKIQYNVSTGFSQAVRIPGILNAKEFAILQNEALVNSNKTAYYTDEEIAAFGEGTNWIDEILQTGYRQNHNLMFSGGTDKLRYALNGDFLDEKGTVMNSWYKRYNVRLNLDTDVTKWLTIGINSFATHSKQHETPRSGENTLLTYAEQYTPTISPKVGGMAGTGGPSHDAPNNAEWWTMDPVTYSNFYANNRNYYPKYRLITSFYADFKIMEGLEFKTTWGINKYFAKNKIFYPSYTYYDSLGEDGGGSIVSEREPEDRQLTIKSYDNYSYTITNVLTYTKTINDVHNINALIGHNDQKYKNSYYSATAYNFPSNELQMLGLGTERQSVSETATHWALRSYFGRLNYDYNGRYLAEFSLRRDASSKFSEDNRWGTFPSGSVGWRISDEKFMDSFHWVSDMKIRASYGILGNQELGVVDWNSASMLRNDFDVSSTTSTTGLYESYATMNMGRGYAFNNTNNTGVAATKYANPDVKWEEAHMLNLGLDLTLFDGKFVVNAEYYNKKTKDLILEVNLPMTTGLYDGGDLGTYYANAGEMKNTGFEYTLHYFKRSGNFQFDIRYSGTHNHNEVTKLQEGIDHYFLDANYSHGHKVGEPYGVLFGYNILGVYQTQEEVDERLQTITERGDVKPGDYIYEDADGDKTIDPSDVVVLGSPLPSYIFGLTANASYKGFDFNIHIQGDLGKKAVTKTRGRFEFSYKDYLNNYDYILDRWHGPGTTNSMARIVSGNFINNGICNTNSVQNVSYAKIRNIELGYTLPVKISRKIGMQKMRVYCNVANLATFTKYIGFEVERTGSYQRTDLYPQCRTISLGANIVL